ncbi:MAG: hypothetical protein J6L71_04115 [Clostridia bacterium]|nr:hypothetical protein [Clostridia bacterium]MBQ4120799.1 hypothetical protein [Clostridia bacterium]
MKKNLKKVIAKATNETEKAKALMAVLEDAALFEREIADPQTKKKIAKIIYALWDAIEETERSLDAAAEVLEQDDAL